MQSFINKISHAFHHLAIQKKGASDDDCSSPKEEHQRGSLIDDQIQQKITRNQPKIELAGVIVERNYWALTCIILSISLALSLIGFFVQTRNAQKNTKLMLVKLYPNGEYDVDRVTFNKVPNYFLTTLNSLISKYIERRYSKHKDSIIADYGFAYQFMSEPMRSQFIDEYKASDVATKFHECHECRQTDVEVGPIQHYEDDVIVSNATPEHEYRSTVFITATHRASNGSLVTKDKKIITLVWKLRQLNRYNLDVSSIRTNPIGLTIIRASVKDSPKKASI